MHSPANYFRAHLLCGGAVRPHSPAGTKQNGALPPQGGDSEVRNRQETKEQQNALSAPTSGGGGEARRKRECAKSA